MHCDTQPIRYDKNTKKCMKKRASREALKGEDVPVRISETFLSYFMELRFANKSAGMARLHYAIYGRCLLFLKRVLKGFDFLAP